MTRQVFTAQLDTPPTDISGLRAIAADLNGSGNWKALYSESDTPEDIRHDNRRRAGFAATAVLAFADECFGRSDEELETVVSDLMGDLMHLCDALNLSFDGLVERGRRHYLPELHGVL